MDDLKASLKKMFEERFSSPLFGYVSLAWIVGNWKPISILFMGKEGVLQRINTIETLSGAGWNHFVPIVSGVALACAAPYLNLALKYAHNRATEITDDLSFDFAERRYRAEMTITKVKVEAKFAEELEEEKQRTRAAILTARKRKIETGMDEMKSKVDGFKTELELMKNNLSELNVYRGEVEDLTRNVLMSLQSLEGSLTDSQKAKARENALNSLSKLKGLVWVDKDGNKVSDNPEIKPIHFNIPS